MRSQLNAYWIFGCIFPWYKYMKNVYLCMYDQFVHWDVESPFWARESHHACWFAHDTAESSEKPDKEAEIRATSSEPHSRRQWRLESHPMNLRYGSALAGERKLWYSVFRIRFIELLIELPHTSIIWRILISGKLAEFTQRSSRRIWQKNY